MTSVRERVHRVSSAVFAPVPSWGPGRVFGLDLAYLVVLVLLLVGRPGHFLDIDRIPNPVGGIVPAGVLWFGALGAVTISLYGIFDHSRTPTTRSRAGRWDPSYNYWHLARPVVGAILALVAYLIFVGVLNAAGNDTTPRPNDTDVIPYLVLAFIVGFRESSFRSLLQRAVDLLLGPGIPGQTPAGVTLSTDATAAPAKGGAAGEVMLVVSNHGGADAALTSVQAVATPPTAATCAVSDDLAGLVVGAGSSRVGSLTITPATGRAAAAYVVQITAIGSFGSASATLAGA